VRGGEEERRRDVSARQEGRADSARKLARTCGGSTGSEGAPREGLKPIWGERVPPRVMWAEKVGEGASGFLCAPDESKPRRERAVASAEEEEAEGRASEEEEEARTTTIEAARRRGWRTSRRRATAGRHTPIDNADDAIAMTGTENKLYDKQASS